MRSSLRQSSYQVAADWYEDHDICSQLQESRLSYATGNRQQAQLARRQQVLRQRLFYRLHLRPHQPDRLQRAVLLHFLFTFRPRQVPE